MGESAQTERSTALGAGQESSPGSPWSARHDIHATSLLVSNLGVVGGTKRADGELLLTNSVARRGMTVLNFRPELYF
jgi:hypothetical protein